MKVDVTLRGLQEAQAENNERIAMLKPGGKRGRAVQMATMELHLYSIAITHVWHDRGGGLRASHRMRIEEGGAIGVVYIDPSAVNPRGQKPVDYGPGEHARGGDHAFYDRAVQESGQRAGDLAITFLQREL